MSRSEDSYTPEGRIAAALERIADVLEELRDARGFRIDMLPDDMTSSEHAALDLGWHRAD